MNELCSAIPKTEHRTSALFDSVAAASAAVAASAVAAAASTSNTK